MGRPPKGIFICFVLLVLIGVRTIIHFSEHVRPVEAVGLSGGGAAIGGALAGMGIALVQRRRGKENRTPPEQQPAPAATHGGGLTSD